MSYISNLVHFIWSTAKREPTIRAEWEERLYPYIGGILENKKAKLLCVGGVADHIHVFTSLPATLSLADAASAMKANSSRFVHEELGDRVFDWQKGYAAFSVSVSGEEAVRRYIENQKSHHSRKSFQEELIEFLEKHRVPYDSRYVFL
ncbi:MAG TPA: IS200/IS605 family transposase [Phycisphaerae bacterium]|nr:IS200/IS605 family transposase [Phycisphaerae bacterium]